MKKSISNFEQFALRSNAMNHLSIRGGESGDGTEGAGTTNDDRKKKGSGEGTGGGTGLPDPDLNPFL